MIQALLVIAGTVLGGFLVNLWKNRKISKEKRKSAALAQVIAIASHAQQEKQRYEHEERRLRNLAESNDDLLRLAQERDPANASEAESPTDS